MVIPASELAASFSRASGPGGQNVNKVETRATLQFALASSAVLPEEAKERLRRLARRWLTAGGDLQITSQRYREQARNLEDCRGRLRKLILRSLVPPRRRRPTRPTSASVARRLADKAHRKEKKRRRQLGAEEDDRG